MGKNPEHDCSIVIVCQGKIPQINPFFLLEKGLISKKQMTSTKVNVMIGGISYENDDIGFAQNLNRIVINLKSPKQKTRSFLEQKMLPLKDTVGDIIAIGINFSCKLPMSVSKQFFNKENPFYSTCCKESDYFGATIISSQDGYDQNITCVPDKAQKIMNFSINNHFPKPNDASKFPVEIPFEKFSKLESVFLKLRNKLVEK